MRSKSFCEKCTWRLWKEQALIENLRKSNQELMLELARSMENNVKLIKRSLPKDLQRFMEILKTKPLRNPNNV